MPNQFTTVLERITSELEKAFRAFVPADHPCALIDYPNHENVGDAAIWAGERALLNRLGREVAYVSDIAAYSERALRRRVGKRGSILLHGGGNFGDLYPHHQRLRERVLRTFPRNPIVMLPQTATFLSPVSLQAMAARFRHPDLVMLLRDSVSQELVESEFSARVGLAPDSAFGLGLLAPSLPAVPLLWLARTDEEAGVATSPALTGRTDVRVADWVGKRSTSPGLVAWREATLLGGGAARFSATASVAVNPLLEASYDRLAAHRVAYGQHLLGGAEVVVTDRLHAHIFALMLGKPHVLLNDRHDKVGRFYRSWSANHPGVVLARDSHEAMVLAQDLLGRTRASSGAASL